MQRLYAAKRCAGLLRLASNPSVFGNDVLTLPDAWQKYDLFLSDPRISFFEEPADIEISRRMYTQIQTFSPKVWNDAYLAAFAVTAGLELVTCDKALTQYQNLTCKILP
ncbi:MAG TPA: hypothetical protein VGZ47_18270 [Gemmataceae bacterium]|jgi:predicted nucleic acid-binding protein|nr:hypothetical protein [Gemmataceae bacterium]